MLCVADPWGSEPWQAGVFSSLLLVMGLKWCLVWNMVGVMSLTKLEQRGEGGWPEGDLLTD